MFQEGTVYHKQSLYHAFNPLLLLTFTTYVYPQAFANYCYNPSLGGELS